MLLFILLLFFIPLVSPVCYDFLPVNLDVFFFFFFGLRSPSLVYLLYILQAAVHTSLKPMLGGPAGSSFSSTISSPLFFLGSFILNCDWPSAYLFPHLHCLWRPATMAWSLLNPHIEPCLEHAIWLFIQQMKDGV